MVNVTSPLLASENRKSIAFPDRDFRIEHIETAYQLENCSYNGNHIGHTCKNVMTESIRVMSIFYIAVEQQGVEEVLDIAGCYRQMLQNAFLLVAENVQENPGKDCRGEHIAGSKMDKTHVGHRPADTSLSEAIGPWSVNVEPGNTESDDGQCKCPVIQSEQDAPAMFLFIRHNNLLSVVAES